MPYVLSHGTVAAANSVVVWVHTDNGPYGIGDSYPSPTFSEESQLSVVGTIREFLAPAVRGMSPLSVELVHQRMDEAIKGNPFAKAAIGIAIYDLAGKILGVP